MPAVALLLLQVRDEADIFCWCVGACLRQGLVARFASGMQFQAALDVVDRGECSVCGGGTSLQDVEPGMALHSSAF